MYILFKDKRKIPDKLIRYMIDTYRNYTGEETVVVYDASLRYIELNNTKNMLFPA